MFAVAVRARRDEAEGGQLFRLLHEGQSAGIQLDRHAGAARHFQHMAGKAEARDIRGGLQLHGADDLRPVRVEPRRPAVQLGFRLFESGPSGLDGRGKDARPQRFGEDKAVPGGKGVVAGGFRRIDRPGDGQPELDELIVQRMPASQHGPGFRHLFHSAAQYVGQHGKGRVFGLFGRREGGHVHHRPRYASHSVHIGKRIGGGRLPEKPGVVADSAKDIHRLHQHHARRRRLHQNGVLVIGETVDDAPLGIGRHRDVGQDLFQQLWSGFRRSACAPRLIHETELCHDDS